MHCTHYYLFVYLLVKEMSVGPKTVNKMEIRSGLLLEFFLYLSFDFQKVLGRCKEIKDNFESRGPSKLLEYGAYEARLFGEMLLKGSVIILEVFDGKM